MNENTSFYTVQDERRAERSAAALRIAPHKSKRIADLREKAADVGGLADATEREAIQAYTALEDLLSRRRAALADLATYQKLAEDVKTATVAARAAAVRLAASARAGDLIGRQGAILAFDNVARILAVAPAIPMLLEETAACIAELSKEIQAICTQHGIDLKAIFQECGTNAASEKPPGRYTALLAGFAGLLK